MTLVQPRACAASARVTRAGRGSRRLPSHSRGRPTLLFGHAFGFRVGRLAATGVRGPPANRGRINRYLPQGLGWGMTWHMRVRGHLAIRRAPCRSRTPGALQCAIPLLRLGLEPLAGTTVAITDALTSSRPVTLDARANGIICDSIPCSWRPRRERADTRCGANGRHWPDRAPRETSTAGSHGTRSTPAAVYSILHGRDMLRCRADGTERPPIGLGSGTRDALDAGSASPRKAQGTALPGGNASRTARNGVAQALRALFRIRSRQPLVTTPLGRYDSSVPGRAVLTRLSVGSRETFPVGDAPRP